MVDKCREALRELQLYLDDECGQDVETAIRMHLGDCPPCFDRAEFERELRAVISRKCRDTAPSTLVTRIMTDLGIS
jgi:mycothiol system anti-sigma-R factor